MPGKAGMKRKISSAGTGRRRMWTAIRILRVFTVPDICQVAETKRDNAWTYLRRLVVHGYLVKSINPKLGRPGEFEQYRLVRNPGPDHPVFCDVCGQSITVKKCKEAEL